MTNYLRFKVFALLWFISPLLALAQATAPAPTKPDYSKEAYVVELFSDKLKFQNDGTSTRELTVRSRVQSDAAVQQLGMLKFLYQSSSDLFVIDHVRVRKPDGSLVLTPPENFQDMPADVTRAAPFYSDIQEKHVAVKGLSPGDVLEYQVHWSHKPLEPGQFWLEYNFGHDEIILSEQLQVSVPRDRAIKINSSLLKPVITEDGPYRFYTWSTSSLEHPDEQKQKQKAADRLQQIARGRLPQADMQLSTFQSWNEVGRWYANLQRDRIKPSDEVRAKAAELTKGMSDDLSKIRALYSFVSTRYRYIGIAFGIGRYQPHAAANVLENQYGDCKDKHTLLASLLNSVGIKAFPALINSDHDLAVDLPSPAQFDHVITVVPQPSGLIWLDTTSEVGPFGYLLPQLRDKHALVIPEDRPAEIMTSPASSPFKALQAFQMEAKLSDDGVLQGKAERTFRGDGEFMVRKAFRATPLAQWKDLAQQISLGGGFGGEVSEVVVSAPDKIEEPFHFTYDYHRKDYSDWANRRISPPLPALDLQDIGNEGTSPSSIWLGEIGEIQFQAQLELPKGYFYQLPPAVHLKHRFADYDATYFVKNRALNAERHLVLKVSELRPDEYDEYKKFREDIETDTNRFTVLSTGKRAAGSYQDAIWELPYSKNQEAARAYEDARGEYQKHNMPGEIADLRHAVELDPKFARAWLWLGENYKYNQQLELALNAYQKAVDSAPEEQVTYKALAYNLMAMKKFEEAIPVWQNFIKMAPADSDGPASLATCLGLLNRYPEAVSVLETASKDNPELANLHFQLGSAYLQLNNEEKALFAFQQAINADSGSDSLLSNRLNSVAYELAEKNKQLWLALQYAEKAVKQEEEESGKIQAAQLGIERFADSNRLAAYWDTLGWVHFQIGHLDEAEKYLKAAWSIMQDPVVGYHLGRVYEKRGKKQQAAQAYGFALQVLTKAGDPEMRNKLKSSLAATQSSAVSGSSEESSFLKDPAFTLSEERTWHLPQIHDWGGGHKSAEFILVLSRDTGIAGTQFLSGAQELKDIFKTLGAVKSAFPFPDESHARVVRRGVLSCSELAKGCIFVFYPANVIQQPISSTVPE